MKTYIDKEIGARGVAPHVYAMGEAAYKHVKRYKAPGERRPHAQHQGRVKGFLPLHGNTSGPRTEPSDCGAAGTCRAERKAGGARVGAAWAIVS